MKKFVKLAAVFMAAAMLLALCACGSKSADDGKKTITLGTSADYPPFEFHILKDGKDEIVGIDVSMAKAIAAEMGAELQIKDIAFDSLLIELGQGTVDFVIAAMEKDDTRDAAADFSDPYYTDVPPKIVTLKDNAANYTSLDDFSGKTVGAQTGTTKLGIVNDQLTGANAVPLQLVTDMVNELVNGKVDAIVVDGAVAKQYAETNKDLAIADASSELGAAQPYCVAVAKGDPKGLLPAINAAIAKMNAENKLESFISAADALKDVWQEVTAADPS